MNQPTLTLKETQLDRIERKLDELLARKKHPAKAGAVTYTPEFEALWKAYPSRGPGNANPKKNAFNAYNARLREGHSHEEMLRGTVAYRKVMEAANKINTELVMQASRFYGPNLEFKDNWQAPVQRVSIPKDNNQLQAFVDKHGLPQARPGEDFFDWRRRIERAMTDRGM